MLPEEEGGRAEMAFLVTLDEKYSEIKSSLLALMCFFE